MTINWSKPSFSRNHQKTSCAEKYKKNKGPPHWLDRHTHTTSANSNHPNNIIVSIFICSHFRSIFSAQVSCSTTAVDGDLHLNLHSLSPPPIIHQKHFPNTNFSYQNICIYKQECETKPFQDFIFTIHGMKFNILFIQQYIFHGPKKQKKIKSLQRKKKCRQIYFGLWFKEYLHITVYRCCSDLRLTQTEKA